MNITLFRDIPEEKFCSMERYADALVKEFRKQNSPLRRGFGGQAEYRINEFTIQMTKFVRPMRAILRWIPVVKDYAFDLYFSRYVLYPWKAKKHQGDINHVIDHSYAHLLYHLDPEKTIVTCHDLIPLKYEKDPIALKVWKYSIEGLRKASVIIADSEATKKDLINYFSRHPERSEGSPQSRGGFFGRKLSQNDEMGVEEKIRVIYLGVEEKFKPIKDKKLLESIGKKYNLPEGKKLLHVGNSLAYKNIEGILKAFAYILRHPEFISGSRRSGTEKMLKRVQHDDAYLVKVGSLTEPQEKLARELGVFEHIVQLKDVIEEDLPAIYNSCNVLVMPSHKEGFGFPVLEAMACGLPVVTSNVSSLPEVAGNAAALVGPENHKEIAKVVVKILNDKSYREKLIKAGLKRVRKFTWRRTAEKTVKAYEEVYKRINRNS